MSISAGTLLTAGSGRVGLFLALLMGPACEGGVLFSLGCPESRKLVGLREADHHLWPGAGSLSSGPSSAAYLLCGPDK